MTKVLVANRDIDDVDGKPVKAGDTFEVSDTRGAALLASGVYRVLRALPVNDGAEMVAWLGAGAPLPPEPTE